MAAIHGVVEAVNTNAPGILTPLGSQTFWFTLTNRANRTETNLVLILTNYQTNVYCGDWSMQFYAAGIPAGPPTDGSFGGQPSYRIALTNRIPPEAPFLYGLRLTAAGDPDPACAINLTLFARVMTNATRYTAGGRAYGGRTNIMSSINASVALPLVELTKTVSHLTNPRFGGSGLTPGCEITYRIWFSNSGNGWGRNLRILDILPARFVETETVFLSQLSGFATNLAVTYSEYQAGEVWTGLPQGVWNSNLRRIRFFASEDIPPGGTGTVHYRVRIR